MPDTQELPFNNRPSDAAFRGRRGTDTYSRSSHVEKHSIREKRMLRISFADVQRLDPLGLRSKYANAASEEFLERFYTVCSIIPITVILGFLFYGLWFMSPNSQNLRVYQRDIF